MKFSFSRMDQNITTLNLPKTKISKLQHLGKHLCNHLSENLLSQLSINLPKTSSNITALEQLEAELSNGCILSYNIELDKVIIDEITSSRIVELTGYPGSGKTQICFQLSITTQLPKVLGGVEGQVIYINTNKNYSSYRIRELSKTFIDQISNTKSDIQHLTEEDILKNIFVFDNNSIVEIFATIKCLGEFLKDKMVKLIIIDSISNPLKDVDSKERTMLIYKMFEELQNLASIFNFAIVITNDVTIRVKDNKPYYTSSFGDSFFDRVNSRICLTKSNNTYVAELVKSPVKPPMKVTFSMF